MTKEELLAEQRLDTREVIDALLNDGSDPDALYEIEHHISAENLAQIEPAMLGAFKLGFEVYEAEEIQLEDGSIVISFDAVMKSSLVAERIDEQVEKLVNMTEELNVDYDGWGTYFESDEAEDEDPDDVVHH